MTRILSNPRFWGLALLLTWVVMVTVTIADQP
jgi:hypothetical protein